MATRRIVTPILLSGVATIGSSVIALAEPPSFQAALFNLQCQIAQVPGCTSSSLANNVVQPPRQAVSNNPVGPSPSNIKLCLAFGIGC